MAASSTSGPQAWTTLKRYGVIDWIAVACLIALNVGLDRLQPHQRGVTDAQIATDPNLQFPNDASIVSNGLLVFLAMILPLIVMVLVFIMRRKQAGALAELRLCVLSLAVSLTTAILVTTFGKKFVGRPRPNFVAYSGYALVDGVRTYSHPENVKDAWQSFPSGHSSTSFAGLGFLACWMYFTLYCNWQLAGSNGGGVFSPADGLLVSKSEVIRRRKAQEHETLPGNNQLPVLLFCTLPLWLAFFVAISRIKDFHHNVEDVVAGCCIGMTAAYFSFRSLYLGRKGEWMAAHMAALAKDTGVESEERIERALEEGGGSQLAHLATPLNPADRCNDEQNGLEPPLTGGRNSSLHPPPSVGDSLRTNPEL